MFLIGCYTGLRYGDIVTLTLDNVEDGTITKRMNKSGILKTVKIPVVSRAKELLSEYPFIEKVSNQKCNVYLKEIAVLLGIKKHVVFHSSRHTFATLALNQGIPVEVVSEVLGHSDIRTTQVYAKMVETTVMEQMQKFK
jgi:integrase